MTIVTMTRSITTSTTVGFAIRSEEDPGRIRASLNIAKQDWLDMGQPEKVDVTIEVAP